MSCHCKKRVTTNNNQQITKSIALTRSLHRSSVGEDDFVLAGAGAECAGQQLTSSSRIRMIQCRMRPESTYVLGKPCEVILNYMCAVERHVAGLHGTYEDLRAGRPYVTCTTNFTKWCFLSAPLYLRYSFSGACLFTSGLSGGKIISMSFA